MATPKILILNSNVMSTCCRPWCRVHASGCNTCDKQPIACHCQRQGNTWSQMHNAQCILQWLQHPLRTCMRENMSWELFIDCLNILRSADSGLHIELFQCRYYLHMHLAHVHCIHAKIFRTNDSCVYWGLSVLRLFGATTLICGRPQMFIVWDHVIGLSASATVLAHYAQRNYVSDMKSNAMAHLFQINDAQTADDRP